MLSLTVSRSQKKMINDLKKSVFYDLLNIAGRVFIVVRYSDAVTIGKRGFTKEEKENGLVLVFNAQMNFRWEEDAIAANLSFNATMHKCRIPLDDVIAIYSPEAQAQFITAPPSADGSTVDVHDTGDADEDIAGDNADNVVRVDFRKRKK